MAPPRPAIISASATIMELVLRKSRPSLSWKCSFHLRERRTNWRLLHSERHVLRFVWTTTCKTRALSVSKRPNDGCNSFNPAAHNRSSDVAIGARAKALRASASLRLLPVSAHGPRAAPVPCAVTPRLAPRCAAACARRSNCTCGVPHVARGYVRWRSPASLALSRVGFALSSRPNLRSRTPRTAPTHRSSHTHHTPRTRTTLLAHAPRTTHRAPLPRCAARAASAPARRRTAAVYWPRVYRPVATERRILNA